jgi:ABC-type phosphate/phosphonate transport system ATPase subunit
LKDLDICIKKGEFIVVIGDVGAGKSSLLHAMIGDMIYLPPKEVEKFGGLEKLASQEEFDEFTKHLLSKELDFQPVVRTDGSLAYVEQQAWI